MTFCEKINLKIGDKILILGDDAAFDKGTVIELIEDEGDCIPLFSDGNNNEYFSLRSRGGEGERWVRVAD